MYSRYNWKSYFLYQVAVSKAFSTLESGLVCKVYDFHMFIRVEISNVNYANFFPPNHASN